MTILTNTTETIDVAAAIIEHRYKYLILKRAPHKENSGLWEFPGGKMKAGESLSVCLERELNEELGVKAEVTDILGSVETRVEDKVIRLFGLKTFIDHEPKSFKDHSEMKWVGIHEIGSFPLTTPDLALVHQLLEISTREREVSHIKLWSLAKLYGSLYSLVGTMMGIFILFSPQADIYGVKGFSLIYKSLVLLFLPIINFILGALFGVLIGFFYNLVAELIGGIIIRLK